MAIIPDLTERRLEPELMDDPALDGQEHAHALAGLRLVNIASGVSGALFSHIRDLARSLGRPVRMLDIATGSGDIPAGLSRLAARSKLGLSIDACDISERALSIARERCQSVHFFALDVTRDPIPTGYDVICMSLFTHHLSRETVVAVLTAARASSPRLILVSDLNRTLAGWALAATVPRIMSRSRVVHTDAVLSVRAAFTTAEFRAIADESGLRGAVIKRSWPCRFLFRWSNT